MSGNGAKPILSLAVIAGVLTGMVEGVLLLVFHRLGWLSWDTAKLAAVSPQIIWISMAGAVVLFIAVGALLAISGALHPRVPAFRGAIFVFATLAFFDWIALTGRIERSSAALLAMGLAAVVVRVMNAREPVLRAALPRGATVALIVFAATFTGIEGGRRLVEWRELHALPTAASGSPNVIVIVADTLRADHLGSYGYSRPTSPSIDAFARQGVLFEHAYAGSSWTYPSHASLLTGRPLHEHEAEWNHPFDLRYPTIAEAFRDRGYRTGAFSANLLWFNRRTGLGRGFLHFDDYFHSVADMALRTFYGRQIEHSIFPLLAQYFPAAFPEDYPTRKRAPEVNAAALEWIDRNSTRPFFVFLNYFDTHDPYLPPEPYRTRFSRGGRPGGRINSRLRHPDEEHLSAQDVQAEIDGYDGAIAYLDAHIGRLLQALDRRDLTTRTIVVLTSDHGEAFGEHGFFEHRNMLYREVTQVPLIIRWPGQVPARTRVTRPVSNVAVASTLLDLLPAANSPLSFPGPPLSRLWQPAAAAMADAWPPPLAEIAQQPFGPYRRRPVFSGSLRALISSRWTYIEHSARGWELYDNENDPGQLRNLAGTDQGREVGEQFSHYVAGLLARTRRQEPLPPDSGAVSRAHLLKADGQETRR